MEFVGWYFLSGLIFVIIGYLSLPLDLMESKLKDQISYTLGGVLLLVFWPAIPLTALVSAWRKIPKR
jgi:hypothetical protein